MREFTFNIDGSSVTIRARNARTAERRFRGYLRGEMDLQGRTIPPRKRKKPCKQTQ